MELFENLKWYNILIIVLLIVITVTIIMLPTQNLSASTGTCNMVCPKIRQEQEQQNEHFNSETKNSKEPKPELILYYATWCHFSREFLDDWSKFDKYAKDNLKNIRVSSVRCEGENEATCQQKGVNGYPTVILYLVDGTEHKFEGPRTVDGLKQFVTQFAK
jgi:thiol-disulfide isomerase/thioredoxin